ncbi:MAG TPA: universal stress protein [Candidatus Binatia bacterium]|nr:universal stress protein [Candidatus Binatia bacterium]
MSERPRILVPVDGSHTSLRALDVAIEFAAKLQAELVICHVVELAKAATLSGGQAELVAGCLEELQTEGKAIVEEATARVGDRVAVSSRIAEGESVDQIERIADEIAPAFIVIGTHGRTGLTRLVMGSVAEGVVRGARVPVMVVPQGRRSL